MQQPKYVFLFLSCAEQNYHGLRKHKCGFGKKTVRHKNIGDEGRRI